MIKFIDVTGKTEDEAIQSALAQLKICLLYTSPSPRDA